MKLLLKGFIFVFTVVNLSEPKVIPIIYEEFEKCVEPEETAGKFDFSELEIIAESDTKVYFNGSWNFLKQVKSPWAVLFSTEKYERGVWNPGPLSKKIKDFCKSIQSQSEPWYSVTRHFEPKNCPFAAGTKWKFDMLKLSDMPFFLPPTMIGKWRLNVLGEFEDEGGKKECMRIYFDLVEK